MFKISMVEKCPYTGAGTGILRLSHAVIANLAGAVSDREEWLALLVGTRSTDGMDVTVTELRIPLQERSRAECSLVNKEPLTPDIVGVVHSHHTMGAFFSTTDDNELNPRFPVSIVVATNRASSTDAKRLLGFDYEAVGRAVLPCGSLGVVDFIVLPTPEVKEWPAVPVKGYTAPNTAITLHDCPHKTKKTIGFMSHCDTKCGVSLIEPATSIFGRDSKDFLEVIKSQTRRSKYQQNYTGVNDTRKYFGKQGHGIKGDRYGYGAYYNGELRDNDREAYLRHWGHVTEE